MLKSKSNSQRLKILVKMSVPLILTERAIKKEPKETYSSVQKGHILTDASICQVGKQQLVIKFKFLFDCRVLPLSQNEIAKKTQKL